MSVYANINKEQFSFHWIGHSGETMFGLAVAMDVVMQLQVYIGQLCWHCVHSFTLFPA